jgi:hypothetical protein
MLAQRYPNFHPILAMLEMYHEAQTPIELRARLLNDSDLSSLVAALSLKQKPQGQAGMNEQAELLRLIKG